MQGFQIYSKTCIKWPLSKRPKNVLQDRLLLIAGQKYCRILSTFIKLPLVIKTFVLSLFECLFYIGFTVHKKRLSHDLWYLDLKKVTALNETLALLPKRG